MICLPSHYCWHFFFAGVLLFFCMVTTCDRLDPPRPLIRSTPSSSSTSLSSPPSLIRNCSFEWRWWRSCQSFNCRRFGTGWAMRRFSSTSRQSSKSWTNRSVYSGSHLARLRFWTFILIFFSISLWFLPSDDSKTKMWQNKALDFEETLLFFNTICK